MDEHLFFALPIQHSYNKYKLNILTLQMKVDPVVNNADELFMANMSQLNKIKFLQTEKSRQESYIKDLQQNLQLNKQTITSLVTDKKQQALRKINKQNSLLISKLQKYYDDYMNVNALLLIEQQLRIQQKKFYSERMLDFETNMIQLRKYLQDKQQSFSSVVNRLKKYEDLSEITLEIKLHKITNDLNQEYLQQMLKKITEQRDKYKNIWEKMNISIDQLTFLRHCLQNKQSYQKMQQSYSKYKQKQGGKQDKGISFYEKTKNTTNYSSNVSANGVGNVPTTYNKGAQKIGQVQKNPNKELIKLLKKQKLNNQILQSALNDAIQKNQQLIVQNSTLVQSNIQLKVKSEKIESKAYLLQQQLTRYDRSLAWKQEWKSKCDMDRLKRIHQFQEKGEEQEICLVSLEQDMQKLSSFIVTCVPREKGTMSKSSSNPNFATNNNEGVVEQEDDLEIQEI